MAHVDIFEATPVVFVSELFNRKDIGEIDSRCTVGHVLTSSCETTEITANY